MKFSFKNFFDIPENPTEGTWKAYSWWIFLPIIIFSLFYILELKTKASTDWNQNFEEMSIGALSGQGDWTQTATVTSTPAYLSSRSIGMTLGQDAYYQPTTGFPTSTATTTQHFFLYYRGADSGGGNDSTEFQLRDTGLNQAVLINYTTGTVCLTWGGVCLATAANTTTPDFWNSVSIQRVPVTGFIQVSVNNGSYSAGILPQYNTGYNNFFISNSTDRRLYFDDFSIGTTSDIPSRIISVSSPLPNTTTTPSVVFNVAIWNNDDVDKTCVTSVTQSQSLEPLCQEVLSSGSVTVAIPVNYQVNGTVVATVDIRNSAGEILDSRSVVFYVTAFSGYGDSTYIEPIQTLVSGWTCNISYLSWDPCATFGAFVSSFLQPIWNMVINILFGWILKPPFSYVGEFYTTVTSGIAVVETSTSTIPTLNLTMVRTANMATTTFELVGQDSLTKILSQSMWDTLRPYLNMILYILFGTWIWHYVRKLSHKLNK